MSRNPAPTIIYKDYFRVSPLRMIGHCFAVAEATRYNISEDIREMLGNCGSGYILCHALHKASYAGGGKKAVLTLFDTLLYDGIACALLPAFLTYHMTRLTASALREMSAVPTPVAEWGPLVVGLTTIAVSYEAIDRIVSDIMDDTIRSLY